MAAIGFSEAKAKQEMLRSVALSAAKALKAIPGAGSGAMGLTPDSVKFSREYVEARDAYARAAYYFADFNKWFVKRFAEELRAERRAR